MSDNVVLGGFTFERNGPKLWIHSPHGSVETDAPGFLRGAAHLLRMEMDLEGQAELSGGLICRIEGERAQLRLGDYTEAFPTSRVEALFQLLTATAAPET